MKLDNGVSLCRQDLFWKNCVYFSQFSSMGTCAVTVLVRKYDPIIFLPMPKVLSNLNSGFTTLEKLKI